MNLVRSSVGVIALAMLLTGCATTRDPTLVSGVERKGGGVYSASALRVVDPATAAVQKCQLDGNKKLSILTSTTERGIASGTNYAVLIFRCE